MGKWADYGISAVRYDSTNTHIEQVQIHEDTGSSIGKGQIVSRQTVVNAIEQGTTFITIIMKNGKWNKGEDVFIVKINGKKYIKTTSNNTEDDNLESLPTF